MLKESPLPCPLWLPVLTVGSTWLTRSGKCPANMGPPQPESVWKVLITLPCPCTLVLTWLGMVWGLCSHPHTQAHLLVSWQAPCPAGCPCGPARSLGHST